MRRRIVFRDAAGTIDVSARLVIVGDVEAPLGDVSLFWTVLVSRNEEDNINKVVFKNYNINITVHYSLGK